MLPCCVEEENKKSQQVFLRFAALNSFSTQTSDRGIQKLTVQKFIQDLEIRSMAYSFNVTKAYGSAGHPRDVNILA